MENKMVNIISAICLLYIFSWIFVVLDNLIDTTIDFIKSKIFKKSEVTTTKYSCVADMMENLKNSPLKEAYNTIYRFFLHIKESPSDSYYNIKYFIQRGRKGYSNRDIWSFDYHLSHIIINGLKDLKKITHATPCGQIGVQALEDKDSKEMIEWKRILGEIIWTFEIADKIRNHNWIPVNDEKDRIELKKYERRLNTKTKKKHKIFEGVKDRKYHLMTKKEMKKYDDGWELFKNYYFDLWD